jgi:hypothetical protein
MGCGDTWPHTSPLSTHPAAPLKPSAQRDTYPLGVVAAETAPGTHPPPRPLPPSHAPAPPCWQPPFVSFPRPRSPPRPVWSGPVALRGLSAPSVWVLGSGSFISTSNRLQTVFQTAFSIWELKGPWQMAHLQRRARAYFVTAYYPSVCGPAIGYHSNSSKNTVRLRAIILRQVMAR